jgi:hypothetical protein
LGRLRLELFVRNRQLLGPHLQFLMGPAQGLLALINAGLAQSKNRSGLGWFLLSLLLGPTATFLIVVLDRVPRA